MMYRKITHNIVEEHFDHPMANEIKSSMERRSGVPSDTIFDKDTFAADVEASVDSYANNLIEMIKMSPGADEQFIQAFERIFTTVDDLGTIAKEFYQFELGERINIMLRGMAAAAYSQSIASKFGKEDFAGVARLRSVPLDAANLLSYYNPTDWEYQGVKALFTELSDAVIGLIKFVQSKDQTKIEDATATIRDRFNKFAKAFVLGTENRFPERFAQPATFRRGYSFVNNEIM
jgi:hypothetical protein